jgi:hypothetical protein
VTGDSLCAEHGERAAIAQFDAGMSQPEAERFAKSLIQMAPRHRVASDLFGAAGLANY